MRGWTKLLTVSTKNMAESIRWIIKIKEEILAGQNEKENKNKK
jgi:hypothetical protein